MANVSLALGSPELSGHSRGQGPSPSTCCPGFPNCSLASMAHRDPRCLSAQRLYHWLFCSISRCKALILPGCRTWLFSWLTCRRFLSAPFSSPSRSLCWAAAQPLGPGASPSPLAQSHLQLSEGTLSPEGEQGPQGTAQGVQACTLGTCKSQVDSSSPLSLVSKYFVLCLSTCLKHPRDNRENSEGRKGLKR